MGTSDMPSKTGKISKGGRTRDVARGISPSDMEASAPSSTSEFGDLLRRFREMHNPSLTQTELAHMIGKHPSFISHLEAGTRHASRSVITAIAVALGLGVEQERTLHTAAGTPVDSVAERLDALIAAIATEDSLDTSILSALGADISHVVHIWQRFVVDREHQQAGDNGFALNHYEQLVATGGLTPTLLIEAQKALVETYHRQGSYGEAMALLDKIAKYIDQPLGLPVTYVSAVHAELTAMRGDIALRQGDYVAARASYEASKAQYIALLTTQPLDAPQTHLSLAAAWQRLGKVALFEGEDQKALDCCLAAQGQLVQAPMGRQRALWERQTNELMAWSFARLGEFERALDLHRAAGKAAEDEGDAQGVMRNLLYVGDDLRRMVEARTDALHRTPRFRTARPYAVVRAAVIAETQLHDRINEAEVVYRDALARCQRLGDVQLLGQCLRGLAIIRRFQGVFTEAEDLLEWAEGHEKAKAHKGRLAAVYEARGDVAWDVGEVDLAQKYFGKSLEQLDSPEGDNPSRRRMRLRVTHALEALASPHRSQPEPVLSAELDTGLWYAWTGATEELVNIVCDAIRRDELLPAASDELDPRWLRILASFEAMSGGRILAQNALSLSLVPTLPEALSAEVREPYEARRAAFNRAIETRKAVRQSDVEERPSVSLSRVKQRESTQVNHDICCRAVVEAGIADVNSIASASEALRLLQEEHPGFALDGCMFRLPLAFAVKGSVVVIELPYRVAKLHQLLSGESLSGIRGSARLCYQLEDVRLAETLRKQFHALVLISRQIAAGTPFPDTVEWLRETLRRAQEDAFIPPWRRAL